MATPHIDAWPTAERYDEAMNALTAAHTTLERLEVAFRVLDDDHDPAEVARESAPVTAEAIADAVWFVYSAEGRVEDLAQLVKTISKWPGLLSHIRAERPVEEASA